MQQQRFDIFHVSTLQNRFEQWHVITLWIRFFKRRLEVRALRGL
ncbi:hypothetical protein DLH98_10670 [Vibrio parahaemolyticus]|uniref:Uncharacterized protein n=1 Tax=Vibrio parahaemolyticus TaxID=670 RepID=A0AA46L3V5_VIBPH|nr:hypothetical protein DA442_11045 [Vibrio parahaemolyticus]EGQ8515509.1 hypothetical protein [Vibrio parahaemolyticus]EGQ8736491.1 hypothetical protein [Vibrio parahaemolyticus]EGQ8904806.1 hypothetical protein [Vibrio parahaemolyticus]EGQ8922845.1 hypothetical protein [Vibrio parahaemolyticus]